MSEVAAEWIAADWGGSRLRAWAMADGRPVAEAVGPGTGTLERDGFEPALRAACGAWLGRGRATPVLVCGMAGAREGWAPAPYRGLDAALSSLPDGAAAPETAGDMAVRILPGLRQDSPPDVMRGEETQIAGLLAAEPDFAGDVVAPGTHSKWARVSGGRVSRFRTFMTGELFALLAERSVLRRSVAAEGTDAAAFEEGVEAALSRPALVTSKLFGLRAAHLLRALDPAAARARLSGLLIGLEIAGAQDFDRDPVVLIGAPELTAAYATALAVAGREARRIDGAEAARAGLAAAKARLFGGAA